MCNEFSELNSLSVYCWPGPGAVPWKNLFLLVLITCLMTAIITSVDTLATENIIFNYM